MTAEPLFRDAAVTHLRQRLYGEVIIAQPLGFDVAAVLVLVALLVLGSFVTWGHYARKETVIGYLTPGPGYVKIYSSAVGRVKHIYVREGALVREGAPLVEIDSVRYDGKHTADVDQQILLSLRDQISSVDADISKQRQLFAAQPAYYTNLTALLEKQIATLQGEMGRQRALVGLARDDLKAAQSLQQEGFGTAISTRHVLAQTITQGQTLDALNDQLATRRSQLLEAQFAQIQAPAALQDAISQMLRNRGDVEQRYLDLESRRATILQAPITGYVSFLQASEGDAVVEQRPLLTIVPSGARLVAELYVPNRAIGFVSKGQEVELEYDAFPSAKYGTYRGKVINVSDSPLAPNETAAPILIAEPVYRVDVAIESQSIEAEGRRIALFPGASLSANIVFDRRVLYEWIFEPLYSLRAARS